MKKKGIKNKKRLIIIVLVVLVIILISVFLIYKQHQSFLFDNKIVYDLVVDYNKVQKEKDLELTKYINDKNITMNDPKVVLDPYGNSPLTALLIFYTEDETNIKLYINNIFVTTMVSSKRHVIPIYGLREDYNNEIKIIDKDNSESILYIKTDKLENSDFYNYESSYNGYESLFINSPKGKYVLDNEGYITWFRDINYNEMDLSTDKKIYFIDKYYRIVETDFLGRVYRVYYTDISYNNHKIKKIDNNALMIIENFSIFYINYNTGEILYSMNLLDELKKIDEFVEIDASKNYMNYFQYNVDNNTLLLSIRGIDAIINYDLQNNKIIWIFSDNEIFSNKFDNYMLNLTSGSYFIGQHTPYLNGNKLYVFDNHNFSFSIYNYPLSGKSSAVIYEINNMNIKEVYRYQSNFSSGWYGNFYEKNNLKNINFGCIIDSEIGNYSKVIELDENDNVVTELTTNYDDMLIYESFRDTFYNEFTSNYVINNDVLELNPNESNGVYEKAKKYNNYNGFKEELKNAIIDETIIEYSSTGLAIDAIGDIDILYVDENYDYYKLTLTLDETTAGLYFYMWSSLLNIKGKYALYIKINDKYYNSNIVFNVI